MIRRVYANQHSIITLDSDMFGSRKRISTGEKADKKLITRYEKNFEEEYRRLYDAKFGSEQPEEFVTLEQYGNMILMLTSQNRRQLTQNQVEKMFATICDFVPKGSKVRFGDMKLGDIKTAHIMTWQMECGYSYQSIKNHRVYFNLVLKTAVNDDLINKNPISLVKLPKKETVHKKVFYTEQDIMTLVSSAKGQYKNYVQLCSFTGLRGSEMVALRWDDIDFKAGSIRVDSRIREGNEDDTKSGKVRFVPMFRQAKEALISQRKITGLGEFVFLDSKGKSYYGPASLNKMFKKLCDKAKVEIGSVHDLRRSFNTILKQYGYPTDWILDVMGHMDDAVNRNHYTGNITVDMSKLENIVV